MALERTAEHDRDSILRAAAGALFGALPLLFTMEMWWTGGTIDEPPLILLLAVTVPVVVLCLLFGGFRRGRAGSLRIDIPIVFGVGIVVAAITLAVVGRLPPGAISLPMAARMIAIEAIPCSIGAALAITQLRPRERHDHADRRIHALSEDLQKVLGTLVGGIFFAFNIAPTEEPWKMTIEAEPIHFPLVVVFSLLASYMIVFIADFAERPADYREGALGNPLSETFVSYLLSLGVSYGFLHAFDHITLATPLRYQIWATVMLGYVTTIGGSAGRVLVTE